MVCYLDILSDPSDAKVYINERYIGKTRIKDYKIYPGRYRIKVTKDGYEDWEDPSYEIKPSDLVKWLRANLKKVGVETGEIRFTSSPKYAKVYIDNEYVGKTPETERDLNPGKYSWIFRKDGYKMESGSVIVRSGERAEVDKKLEAEGIAPPIPLGITAISINSDPTGANIFIDGIDTGKKTPYQIDVVEGLREIKLTLEGYEDYKTTETIPKGAIAIRKYTLEKAVPEYRVLPEPPATIHDEGLVLYKELDRALFEKDKGLVMELLRRAITIEQSPVPLLVIIFGIAGVIGTLVALIGSYPFAGFIREEAFQAIDFAMREAEKNKDTELLEKAIAMKEDLLERTLWEKILGAIPIVTLMKELQDYYKAAALKLEADRGTLERVKAELGELELPEVIKVFVRDIIDGDTIDTDLKGIDAATGNEMTLPQYGTSGHARVRIVGINAPEKSPKGEILCTDIDIFKVEKKYADYARDVLLPLNDKQVTLYLDPENMTDTFGRLLAAVKYEGKDIGLEQIKKGMACWYFREPNKYVEDDLYKEETLTAKEDEKGMWSEVPEEVEEIELGPIMFTINSVPERAKVYIDEVYTHHLTPTNEEEQKDVIHLWTEGKHKIRLDKAGYAAEQEIELIRGERLTLSLELTGIVEEIEVPEEVEPPVVGELITAKQLYNLIETFVREKKVFTRKEWEEIGIKYKFE